MNAQTERMNGDDIRSRFPDDPQLEVTVRKLLHQPEALTTEQITWVNRIHWRNNEVNYDLLHAVSRSDSHASIIECITLDLEASVHVESDRDLTVSIDLAAAWAGVINRFSNLAAFQLNMCIDGYTYDEGDKEFQNQLLHKIKSKSLKFLGISAPSVDFAKVSYRSIKFPNLEVFSVATTGPGEYSWWAFLDNLKQMLKLRVCAIEFRNPGPEPRFLCFGRVEWNRKYTHLDCHTHALVEELHNLVGLQPICLHSNDDTLDWLGPSPRLWDEEWRALSIISFTRLRGEMAQNLPRFG